MRNNKHLHTTGHPHAGHRARGLLARPRVCRLAWRLCCAAVAVCLFSCDSDQPDYLEPRLTTLPATDLTRTDATLHGSATVAGETEMPQLYFRYGATEAMDLEQTFHKLMESRGAGLDDENLEEKLGDAVVFQGVSKYPMRIKCALLGWEGLKDSIAKALAAKN